MSTSHAANILSTSIQTNNQRICSFYAKNPSFNFENINIQLIEMLEKMVSNENIIGNNIIDLKHSVFSLNDVIHNIKNDIPNKLTDEFDKFVKNCKNNMPDDKPIELSNILSKIYPTCEITRQKQYETFNIFLLKRYMKQHVYIECKDDETNILSDDIQNFIKIIEETKSNGIFISNRSGISTKLNFQIDYHHGNIVVYIHNANYCHEKIKSALDIIDNLSIKLKELNQPHGECIITKALLDDINKEYQLFLSQKEALINVYKDCQKKVLSQIDEIRFPCLDKYLSTKYTASTQKQGFKCELCKAFNANNLKALAAHKRGCQRKNIIAITSVR